MQMIVSNKYKLLIISSKSSQQRKVIREVILV